MYSAEGAVVVPPEAHSLQGFREWASSASFPERGLISFLGGELVIDMSPEEYQSHGSLKAEISAVLYQLVRKRKLGHFFPDRTLITNDRVGLSTEPDAAFASFETLESGQLRRVPKANDAEKFVDLQGTPDWVLEIISDSSEVKDG
jgi:Uma2 family endonuclease